MKKWKISFQSLFDNDYFVKIFALLAGVIAWFAVMISQMTDTNWTIYNVPVQINYEGSIPQSLGLQRIGDTEIMISVNVTGKNSKVQRLTPDDFNASISLNSVNKAQSYTLPIDVTKKNNDPDYQITGYSETTATLVFDKIVSKQLTVQINAPKLSAADDYIMQQPYADVENIVITGPQNEIDKIDRCVVNIDNDNENLTENLVVTGTPVLLDEKGTVLTSEHLTIEPSVVEVTVPVYKTKKMTLQPEFINVPKGFPLDELDYTLSQNAILVAASPEIIDNQDSITIGPIDFRTIDIGKEFTLDVVLPAGYINQENVTSVTLTIPSWGLSSRTFSIPKTNFVLENVPAGFEASVIQQTLSNVKIVGDSNVVEDLTADDLVVSIDLSEVTAIKGQYNVTARVYCQNSVAAWAVGEYSTTVLLTEKS
ncbi:MAG: YbbR-like domain-containing protein [Candidatus Merdivicinus sp.]